MDTFEEKILIMDPFEEKSLIMDPSPAPEKKLILKKPMLLCCRSTCIGKGETRQFC